MSLKARRHCTSTRPPGTTVAESQESFDDGWDLDTGDDWCSACDCMFGCDDVDRCAAEVALTRGRYAGDANTPVLAAHLAVLDAFADLRAEATQAVLGDDWRR